MLRSGDDAWRARIDRTVDPIFSNGGLGWGRAKRAEIDPCYRKTLLLLAFNWTRPSVLLRWRLLTYHLVVPPYWTISSICGKISATAEPFTKLTTYPCDDDDDDDDATAFFPFPLPFSLSSAAAAALRPAQ